MSEVPSGRFVPAAVAGITIAILLISQPLNGNIAGFPANIFASVIVAIGGILGTLG